MSLLVNRYSVVILLAVAVMALVIGIVLSTVLTRTLSTWEGESVAAFVRHHVRLTELDELFTAPRTEASQERWAEALPDIVANLPGVVQCRIWDREGQVLWTEAPGGTAQALAQNPGLQAALQGQIVAELRELAPTERAQEFATLIDVFVPILGGDRQVLGVIEIYKHPTQLLSSLTWGLVAIWAVSLAGGAVLYVVVLRLARQAAGRATALPAPSPRPGPEIAADIARRFGFVPPFFEPAMTTPVVLENLWQQTVAAYLENPIPSLFKERLFAYLSRYCAVPYCIVCHSCALSPLGMTATDVLALIESPPPTEVHVTEVLVALLDERAPQPGWPAPGSPLERALMTCAVQMFLHPEESEAGQAELRRILTPAVYAHLTAFLAYVKTCHLWVETHPEIAYEADERARRHLPSLLEAEPRLADFFRTYPERVKRERQRREHESG